MESRSGAFENMFSHCLQAATEPLHVHLILVLLSVPAYRQPVPFRRSLHSAIDCVVLAIGVKPATRSNGSSNRGLNRQKLGKPRCFQ